MISFIICSINPSRCEEAIRNIAATVGVSHEILIHDNRKDGWGIAKVYNHLASKVQGKIICFMHEDVTFLTDGWGSEINSFYASHPEAGIVGFFGTQIKTKTPSGVSCCKKFDVSNYVQCCGDGREITRIRSGGRDYTPVVHIDGMCMIVPRKIWAESPFDEVNFPGFHFYDLDFSLTTIRRYTNYVCHKILIKHDSEGNYNDSWCYFAKIFHDKWNDLLPITSVPMSKRTIRKVEAYMAYKFYRNLLNRRQSDWIEYARRYFDLSGSLFYRVKLLRHIISYRAFIHAKGKFEPHK